MDVSVYTNEYIQNFQKNYINKYSLLFLEKEELLVQNKNLRAVIEEQKRTIDKLRLNSRTSGIDADTQTEHISGIDVQIQTDTQTSVATSQTGKNSL